MGSYTGQVLIGGSHPNHGGIIPDYRLYLSENSRPALILEKTEETEKITWIPTLENMMGDVFLMISTYVLKDQTILDKLQSYFDVNDNKMVEMYDVFTENKLQKLYQVNKEILKKYEGLKVAISVFEGSYLKSQLPFLEEYEVDMEVCTPIYNRYYNQWQGEVVIEGRLK